jgi:hypothetical protein
LAAAVCLSLSPTAHAAWTPLGAGASPINQANDRDAVAPSLASIDGVPYIAWGESDGAHFQLRVSRLNSAGTGWEQVPGGASPINQDASKDAGGPSLASVNGVPYVAWLENDGTNDEVRVSRLNLATSTWSQPWTGVSATSGAINQSTTGAAFSPSLASVNGVPYVAWTENDGTNTEVRVSRLNLATSTWSQPWTGVSATSGAINQSTSFNAVSPSLASIGGVPYVAWSESDGTNFELRVSRLNDAGTAWQQVVPGASPINENASRNANGPNLASIDGVPYVAWAEPDATGFDIRVSRLNATATAWQQVVGGASPINESDDEVAVTPRLASFDGVPYVAWEEAVGGSDGRIRVSRLNSDATAWQQVPGSSSPVNASDPRVGQSPSLVSFGDVPYVTWTQNDGAHLQIRTSRLEPEFVSESASLNAAGATLSATLHTYGIPFPVGFEYGDALQNSTTAEPAPAGADTATVTQQVSDLQSSSAYPYRPFATLGVPGPRLVGPTQTFSTVAEPPADSTPPETKFKKRPENKLDGSTATYKFTSTEAGSSFECKLDRKKYKPCSSPHKLKHLKPGKHKFSVRSIDAAGNPDPSPAKDKFKVVG